MLEEKDIEQLKEVFATKEDLREFATKKDLEKFATKEDIQQIREEFATKEALEKTEVSLANHMIRMEERLENKIDGMTTTLDEILGLVSTQRDEQIMIAHDQEKHKKWIHQIAEETNVVLQD